MRKFNFTIIIICLIILFINIFFFTGESGMGIGILWMYTFYPTVIICGFLLALTLFIGIVGKELFKPYTILNIVIICLTGTSPFWIN